MLPFYRNQNLRDSISEAIWTWQSYPLHVFCWFQRNKDDITIVAQHPYSTSLGCRRQPSLACHAWNHGKSPKSSPLSQQCRFHCHTWSAGESHYCVNSKGFMKFGTHTNEESNEYQQKWLPLSDLVGLCSKYIAIPYGSMAFILKNLPFPTVSRVKGL